MTPQLQQAIKMLQLSNLELAEFVEAEIEQNPLLEHAPREAEEGAATADPDGTAAPERDRLPLPQALAADVAADAADHWRASAGSDGDGTYDLPGDFGAEGHNGHSRNGSFDGDDLTGIERAASRPQTLREHLIAQIGADLRDPGDRVIGFHLLDQLDEMGYLRSGLEGAAERLGCPEDRVRRVLARLQEFDPPGVFARDLGECLALQLRDRDRLDPAMQRLLDNLPLLATRNIAALVRLCGVDAADVADMIGEIKCLDPRPGLAFDPPLAQPVMHDILMRAQPDGGWILELNSETLPRVLVNSRYCAEIRRATRKKEEKNYLTERLHAANWLVKSLHQRATTILKVAAEIVRQQDAFFGAASSRCDRSFCATSPMPSACTRAQ